MRVMEKEVKNGNGKGKNGANEWSQIKKVLDEAAAALSYHSV